MYLHLGNDVLAACTELISIIDIEKQMTKETEEIMKQAQDNKTLVMVGKKEKNKSLVICQEKVYVSPISSTTLYKRAMNINWEDKNDD